MGYNKNLTEKNRQEARDSPCLECGHTMGMHSEKGCSRCECRTGFDMKKGKVIMWLRKK